MVTKKIVYVGVDVDDTAFHGAGIILETGELFEFKCKPDHGVLRKKLNELFSDRYEIHLCYEACYLGYSLCLPMFNGAHAIFGFQSNNFYWSGKSDWLQCAWNGCDYTNNWDQETYFINTWFSGQNMWTAYSNAITQNYNLKDYFWSTAKASQDNIPTSFQKESG